MREAAPPRKTQEALFSEDFDAGRDLRHLRDDLERVFLKRLFRDTKGDLQAMVRALDVKQSILYRWLKRLDIDVRALRWELGEER